MDKKTYFISYTTRAPNDIAWATWVDWVLREKLKAETIMQKYDFMPGDNFKARMHNALKGSDAVVCILTRDYLESANCKEEWTNANKIIPVRFDSCDPTGLLASRIYIDLYGLDKDSARSELISKLQGSKRPVEEPDAPFAAEEPDFPTVSARVGSAVMHNLPNRNSYFTGRIDMLAKIYTAFQSFPTVSIIGAGGFGKTQIAVEYAYIHAAEYRLIWYFNAESETQLKDSYRGFAYANCGIKDASEIEYAYVKRVVDEWFKDHSPYLLIYDNAEGCPELKEHLTPNREECHILVISREKPQGIVSKKLNAAVFSAEDSVDFLKKRIPIDDVDAAKEIAIELGHLPLALECAVSCIEENDYALTDYLNLYKKQRDIRYLSALPESTEYNKAILNVWGITFDRIKKEAASDVQTEAAVQLFRLCAYCASDDIPLQLFIDGREETPQPLRGCLSPGNNLAHDSIIRKLERYSLVSMHRAGGRPLITVHRLIQEAAIYYFEQNEEWVGRCLKISNSVFDYQYGTRAEFEEFSANMPHVIKIARYAEKYLTDRDSPASITRIYNEIGIGLYYQGKYAEALEWYLKALVIRKKVLGAEHPRTAAMYNNIAVIYQDQGDYAKALEWHHKALAIREAVLGTEHTYTAATYNNIASVYQGQDKYAEALEWHHKALAIREKVLGAGHPDTAATYNNIAGVYKDQGKYAEALECYYKALAIREKVLGAGHPDTAATYNNIAGVYQSQGDYARTLEWNHKALAIQEKVLGAGHPDTATTYNNIAGVYQGQGDYAEALEWYNKALAIREKILGAGHPYTATIYNNIAGVYKGQGKYAEALERLYKALAIREKVLGAEHPDTAATENNIADVYLAMDDKVPEA